MCSRHRTYGGPRRIRGADPETRFGGPSAGRCAAVTAVPTAAGCADLARAEPCARARRVADARTWALFGRDAPTRFRALVRALVRARVRAVLRGVLRGVLCGAVLRLFRVLARTAFAVTSCVLRFFVRFLAGWRVLVYAPFDAAVAPAVAGRDARRARAPRGVLAGAARDARRDLRGGRLRGTDRSGQRLGESLARHGSL